MIQNLGGDTSFTLASTAASANTVVANIKNHIKTINEELATDYFLKYTLSATEKNATDAWALELGGSGDSQNLKLLNRQKKQNQTNASKNFGACAVLSF